MKLSTLIPLKSCLIHRIQMKNLPWFDTEAFGQESSTTKLLSASRCSASVKGEFLCKNIFYYLCVAYFNKF